MTVGVTHHAVKNPSHQNETAANAAKVTEISSRRVRLRRWRRHQAMIGVLLVAVFGFGLVVLLRDKKEIFPFYSWSMFGLVPQRGPCTKVVILEVPGHSLSTGVNFQEADNLVRSAHSVVASHLITNLGRALELGSAESANGLRRQFELNYLYTGTRYRLVRDISSPVQRFKKIPGQEIVLAEWTKTKE